ncbi:MAG: hypothetical protein WCE87_05815, partial [Candidatus Udaeobacter sp.]
MISSLALAVFLVLGAGEASAQNERPLPTSNSDLARQNFSRVAASATDIKTVLVKDSGIMVELKRWVAKDATQHG